MSKALIVADLKYKSPKRRGRGSGQKGLRGALKYFQYREDHNTKASPSKLRDRWQDRGLGAHYREIQANCDRLKSQHVLAWTWVVSPAPDLMALVPEKHRRALVMERAAERIAGMESIPSPLVSLAKMMEAHRARVAAAQER